MTRRGPVPGTTGRPAAEVARVCIDAYANGRNMAQAVADHYRCSIAAARSAVSRARKAHTIPYDYGYTDPVRGWQQCGGHDPRWVAAVTHAHKVAAARRAANPPAPKAKPPRTPRALRKFTPPRPTGRTHLCADCGHQAATGWELAGHTLDTHGRTLTATERAPYEVAA
jgi:hypothetical protein